MKDDVKYDQYYRDDPAACGTPFTEFEAFCDDAAPGTVLDLGCGQGRDALMFARAGHRVVGVDISSVGVGQMCESARAEGLDVQGFVSDVRTFEPDRRFDIVILDRVLHMLDAEDRIPTLENAMRAVADGGHLLVAEGPKGMVPVREAIERAGFSVVSGKPNRLFAKREPTAS